MIWEVGFFKILLLLALLSCSVLQLTYALSSASARSCTIAYTLIQGSGLYIRYYSYSTGNHYVQFDWNSCIEGSLVNHQPARYSITFLVPDQFRT